MKKRLLGLAALSSLLLLIGPNTIQASNDVLLEEASVLYEQGDFDIAFKMYLKLGKKGEWFSQYRLSYMYLKGQGTRQDMVEALAWAVLAAQSGQSDELTSYKDAVATLVPEDRRQKARHKADYYLRRWGEDEKPKRRPSTGSCTGSHLKTNCEPTSSSLVWIQWNAGAESNRDPSDVIEVLNRAIVDPAS